jgi:hypothetical protein
MFLRLSFQLRSACGSRDRSVRVRVRVRTVGRSGLPLLLHLLVHANLPLRAIRGMIFAHTVGFQSLVAKVLCHTCCSYPCRATLRRFLRPTRYRLRFVARLCRDCSRPVLSRHKRGFHARAIPDTGFSTHPDHIRTHTISPHTLGIARSPPNISFVLFVFFVV